MLTTWALTFLTIVACATIAGTWAVFRPGLVHDNEGRTLPYSLTARVFFVLLVVFAYLALAVAFLFSSFFTPRGFLQEFDQAFVLALFAFFGLYSSAWVRETERLILIWLHQREYHGRNTEALSAYLTECAFNISVEEHDRNLKTLEVSGIFITDSDLRGINLGSIVAWRKTAFLLRCVRAWNSADRRVLGTEDWALFLKLEHSHAGQSRFAVESTRRFRNDEVVPQPSDMRARVWGSRKSTDQMQGTRQAKFGNETGLGKEGQPVRLPASQRQQHLKRIEDNVIREYRVILERVSRLAAISIVHADADANYRLNDLKAAGFEGLGSIHPLTSHRILWLFLAVAIGGFLSYYLLWYDITLQRVRDLPGLTLTKEQIAVIGQTTLIGFGFFVASIAVASLIGTLVGSDSANARAKETPWGKYVVAGLISATAFLLMEVFRESVMLASGLSDALSILRPSTWVTRFRASVPWLALPFFITVGICWLARQKPWPPVGALGENGTALLQRMLDGVVIGVLMLPAYFIAISVLVMSGSLLPPVLGSRFDLPVVAILAILGFIVGATVVRDTRSAAHAQLILPNRANMKGNRPVLASAHSQVR
jgi:hypothetical protein